MVRHKQNITVVHLDNIKQIRQFDQLYLAIVLNLIFWSVVQNSKAVKYGDIDVQSGATSLFQLPRETVGHEYKIYVSRWRGGAVLLLLLAQYKTVVTTVTTVTTITSTVTVTTIT